MDIGKFFSGGRLNDSQVWGHGTRIDHFRPLGTDDGRADLGRKPAGTGEHVPFHGAHGRGSAERDP